MRAACLLVFALVVLASGKKVSTRLEGKGERVVVADAEKRVNMYQHVASQQCFNICRDSYAKCRTASDCAFDISGTNYNNLCSVRNQRCRKSCENGWREVVKCYTVCSAKGNSCRTKAECASNLGNGVQYQTICNQREAACDTSCERYRRPLWPSEYRRDSFTCVLAKSCPRGWTYQGIGGIILANGNYRAQPAIGARGAPYNSGWTWVHPQICCSDRVVRRIPSGVTLLSATCPSGTDDLGLVGELMSPATSHPLVGRRGAGIGHGWTWTHPRACKTNGSLRLRGSGACVFQNKRGVPSAAGGQIVGNLAGFIIRKQDISRYGAAVGARGAQFNPWWDWRHPVTRCFPGQSQ